MLFLLGAYMAILTYSPHVPVDGFIRWAAAQELQRRCQEQDTPPPSTRQRVSCSCEGGHYVGQGAKMLVRVWSFKNLNALDLLFTLALRSNGEIITTHRQYRPTPNGLVNSYTLDLPEGIILSMTASNDYQEVKRGDLYVQISTSERIGGSDIPGRTILAGYVYGLRTLSYPPYVEDKSNIFPGNNLLDTPANPAPGAGIAYTFPLTQKARIHEVSFRLTTGGAAGSRLMQVELSGATNKNIHSVASASQGPGTTVDYYFGVGLTQTSGGASRTTGQLPLNLDLVTPITITIQSATGLGAADQLSNIQIGYERLIQIDWE